MTIADKTFTDPFDIIPEAVSGQALGSAANRWELFGGQMLLNAQPVFSVEMSANITNMAIGVDHTVTFDTEVTDRGGNFNVGTYTFTAPEGGQYALALHLFLAGVDSAATYVRCRIVTSNRTYLWYFPAGQLAADSNAVGVGLSVIADMDAADTSYATIRAQGGAVQMDVASGDFSRFMGWLLG